MKVRFVEAERAQHPVSLLCTAAGITPAGYYAARRRPESQRVRRDHELCGLIATAHTRSRRTYGAPRIHADLAAAGVQVAKKRVARLMRQHGLAGVSRRGTRRTTFATRQQRQPRIASSGDSLPTGRISYGSPTSPTSRPWRDGSFWPS